MLHDFEREIYFSKMPVLSWRLWRDTAGSDIAGDDGDEGDELKVLSAADDDGPLPLGFMTDRSAKSPALCSSKPCAWWENEEKSWSWWSSSAYALYGPEFEYPVYPGGPLSAMMELWLE